MAECTTIGMIGCGGMMGAHESGFRQLHEKGINTFEIVATCDINREAAEKMADTIAEWQGSRPKIYVDVDTMLREQDDMQAVDIVTTHRSHHTVIEPCFAAGKHVTIEKPLAFSLRAGKQILNQADAAGTVFQVAENYRRDVENRAIKWAVDEGMIGDLRMIYWIDVEERLWDWTWRDQKDVAGGGWPLDGGVHFADLFRYHIGDPESIYCGVRTYNTKRYGKPDTMEDPIEATIEDTTLAIVNFPNGVIGQWSYSLSAPGHKFSNRALYGNDGALVWGEGLKTRTRTLSTDELVAEHKKAIGAEACEKLYPRGITDTIATELHEFIETIQGRDEIEITGLEGYKDEVICMALYESQELGRPVTFDEVANLEAEAYQSDLNKNLEGLHR
jgi:predicted dehydrogenase